MTTRSHRAAAAGGLALAVVFTGGVVSSADAAVKPKAYKNCTALNKVYPHGVGKPHAKDKTTGIPVKNFTKSKKLYKLNKRSDRDRDGIACEKR